MAETRDLIRSLAADAAPVRRLASPLARISVWLGLAVVIVVTLGISHGLRPNLTERLADPLFVTGILAAFATGILAAVAAFMLCLPDRSTLWGVLPVPAALIWVSTIGYGCLTDWVAIGPGGISPGAAVDCFSTLTLVGTPLSLALVLMMRHVRYLRTGPVTICGALAVAAITAAALSLFHDLDATILTLMWNLGTAALFLALGGIYGRTIRIKGVAR